MNSNYYGTTPTIYPQREVGAKFQARPAYIASNTECARRHGSSTQLKWLEGTVVEPKQELRKSGTHQEWYITADYILGEDGTTTRVHISQRNVNISPMPPPPPEPQSRNEIAQEGNGTSIVSAVVLDSETLTMASRAGADTILVAPMRNPPAVGPFPLQIDVSPPLPPPLLPEPLPLIALPPSPSDSVADKEDDVVVECHQKKWKEYVKKNKTEICPLLPMAIKNDIW